MTDTASGPTVSIIDRSGFAECVATAAAAAEGVDELEQDRQALVLGLRDYVTKCGARRVVLGLSGGVDSALVAALAVDALGADAVLGIAMPSRYSSERSLRRRGCSQTSSGSSCA